MIHTAMPDAQVYKIPGAKAAVDKEWDKLFGINGFAVDEAEEQSAVAKRYKQKGKRVHFGTLRALCHEKGCELSLIRS